MKISMLQCLHVPKKLAHYPRFSTVLEFANMFPETKLQRALCARAERSCDSHTVGLGDYRAREVVSSLALCSVLGPPKRIATLDFGATGPITFGSSLNSTHICSRNAEKSNFFRIAAQSRRAGGGKKQRPQSKLR